MKTTSILSAFWGLGLSLGGPIFAQAPVATPAVPVAAPELKAPNDVKVKDGDRFIFIGDSITHQCQYTQYVEDFYYTRYPHLRLHFRNAGISGDRAQDVLNRWEEDIAAFKPTIATILIGMNDGSYRDFDQETFDTYKKGMLEIMKRLDAMNCRVILMSPTMFDHQAFDQMVAKDPAKARGKTPTNYNAVLAYYGKWAQEVARERGYQFADLYTPLNHLTVANRKKDLNFTLIPDAIHPEADGQLVMAHALLRDIGETRSILAAGVRWSGKEWIPVKNQGKTTSKDVTSVSNKALNYVVEATSLPWAVYEEAPIGSKLLRAPQSATAEFHMVSGLPAGQYDLWVNGKKVHTYGAKALSDRVNIAADPDSPTYQQALKVVELNKKRNEEAVRPLRNLWAKQKGMLRKKESDPTAYEAWQKQFKEERAKLDALADKYENQIYEINKVKPLKIEIKPAEKKAA